MIRFFLGNLMRPRLFIVAFLLTSLLSLALPGCTLLGAGLGAMLGSPYQGAAVGAYVGALLDNQRANSPAPSPKPAAAAAKAELTRLKYEVAAQRARLAKLESPAGGGSYKMAGHTVAARPPPPAHSSALEHYVHMLVNEHRTDQGLKPLAFSPEISAIARQHSRDMEAGRQPLGHGDVESRQREVSGFISLSSLAENVAMNTRATHPGDTAVYSWLRSAGHRRNIEGDFDLTGIGIARTEDSTYFFTQLFISR